MVCNQHTRNIIALFALLAINSWALAQDDAEETPTPKADTGIEGVTIVGVIGGAQQVKGGAPAQPVQQKTLEFAIAPVNDGKPDFKNYRVIASDKTGKFKFRLVPGQYWIGPPDKAKDPEAFKPEPGSRFPEQIVVVRDAGYSKVRIAQITLSPQLRDRIKPRRP